MSEPVCAGVPSSVTSKAKELSNELKKLQSHVESLDANSVQEAVLKLQDQVTRINQRIQSALQGNLGASSMKTKDAPVVQAPAAQTRGKIEKMSAEVVDSNPYSRLMALQRMGIVKDYELIRHKTVAVVGVGGVGSVAAEMLTRCGLGRLLLYDYDTVEQANMNRLFFRPEQCGMTKTDAAAQTLAHINPDVQIESFTMNITTVDGFEQFKESVTDASGASRVDLILSCVDNYEARITINQVCLELNQVWMESGVSEDAVSGHIQQIIPGETACFQCVPPLVVASGIDERTLKREGVCAASLPTTMGIVAGLLVQNSLKYLLEFGTVSKYLGYSSLKDFFPTMEIKPNPTCGNSLCQNLQAKYQEKLNSPEAKAAAAAAEAAARAAEEVPAVHEDNEWKIEVVSEDAASSNGNNAVGGNAASNGSNGSGMPKLTEGIEFSMPAAEMDKQQLADEAVGKVDESVDDLMAQLKGLSGP